MSGPIQIDRVAVAEPGFRSLFRKVRWPLWSLGVGLILGAWVGGGPDRYGEEEGIAGSLRGAGRTMVKCFQYTGATIRDTLSFDRSSVRRLGLTQQVETRLWQDKRLVADNLIVDMDGDSTIILKGIVPDLIHKDQAVTLARETRGVEKVVDEMAIRPSARTIDAVPAAAVPTGVATNPRNVR